MYIGRPVPKSKWTKNKADLPADDNLSMSQKPEMCKLQIQKARRKDAGEYELHLENASGKIDVPITIKVIGKLLSFDYFLPRLEQPGFLKNFFIDF